MIIFIRKNVEQVKVRRTQNRQTEAKQRYASRNERFCFATSLKNTRFVCVMRQQKHKSC